MCVCFYEDHCVFLKHFSREGRRLALLRSSSMWKSHVIIILYGMYLEFLKNKRKIAEYPHSHHIFICVFVSLSDPVI